MPFEQFLLLQFLAHVLADYFFQTSAMAYQKNKLGFKSRLLPLHILIVFVCSWLLSFQIEFFVGAGIIAILHYIIDGFKAKVTAHKSFWKYAFFADQLLHLAVLVGVSWVFSKHHGLAPLWENPFSTTQIAIAIAYLCCLKPANIIIKEVFRSSQIDVAIAAREKAEILDGADELPNAGKLIGILERTLALTFILIGQYQAVGFLIAAKSVLRYKDTDTLKTEYVLIGTMLSFGIAVVLGILAGAI
ncbi:MAG TPA: DUF3307 domain-containing protein [Flavobacteriaceae bacterium]|jgi:energy-coupling factor transporter transmembrane protein EcfT|nr:DUF3307 domain-containing protein [Flavobacteriaceae bacterium]HIN97865.1 DUF3307 domain-containing protein [Flavobacteriaceae bacterium]|tara:strand:- start:17908 stop:18645 length:738 start_codon:yes stop_codon:yes gene_type:complete